MVVLFVTFLSANYRLDARGGWVHPALPEDRAVWSKHAALLWTVSPQNSSANDLTPVG